MYCLLFSANLPDQRVLDRACRITTELMPAMGVRLNITTGQLPEVSGGWFFTSPATTAGPALISVHQTASVACIVYGTVYNTGNASAAEIVEQSWSRSGADGVRHLDGNFSAIITDLKIGKVHLLSDLLGQRSLRYVRHENRLLISTHDLPIVATGLCPPTLDLPAVSTMIGVGWSLGGASLIEDIEVCKPDHPITWHEDTFAAPRRPVIDYTDRLDPADGSGCRRQVEKIIETLQQRVRRIGSGSDSIYLWLTGGQDSRAALAVLLSVYDARQIKIGTIGTEVSTDVQVARRIAHVMGIDYERLSYESPTADKLLENIDVLAFFRNGNVNSKYASYPRFCYPPDNTPAIGGTGGEAFRGVYYPKPAAKTVDERAAQAAILRWFPRVRTLRWSHPEFGQYGIDKVQEICSNYFRSTRSGHDAIDMFYVFESISRFALCGWLPHLETSFNLFQGPDLHRQMFRLPSPIAKNCNLNSTLIKRYLNRVYWWPVNDKKILPILNRRGAWRLARLLRYIRLTTMSLKARSRITSQVVQPGMAQPTVFYEQLHDQLLLQDGIADTLFGLAETRKMIDAHVSGAGLYLAPLGYLLTLERWYAQVRQAWKMAR